MTWSYNPALPANLDKVRFWSGDVDTTDQQVADETISALLVLETNVKLCARGVCLSRAAFFARFADENNGALEVKDAVARGKAFVERAATLKEEVDLDSVRRAAVRVGGVTYSQDDRIAADTDAKKSLFRVGQFNNRRSV